VDVTVELTVVKFMIVELMVEGIVVVVPKVVVVVFVTVKVP
jgi:hypothetical protein